MRLSRGWSRPRRTQLRRRLQLRNHFWGGSFIADPFGRILAQASHNQEEIVTATLDPALVETTRQHWPFLRDRRIDAYANITSRFLD